MERKDIRGIGLDAQEALHERAVYLLSRGGKTQAETAGLAGVRRQVARGWILRHCDKGACAMDAGFPAARAAGS